MRGDGVELTSLWNEYGMEELNQGLQKLFPDISLDMKTVFMKIASGDLWDGCLEIWNQVLFSFKAEIGSFKTLLIWLLLLGILSALFSHFSDMFDNHQISDLSFYFIYLLLAAVLSRSYLEIAAIAAATISNIVLFMKLFIPTYLIAVGAAAGTTTAFGYYQITMLVLYGTEQMMNSLVLPLVNSYVFLVFMNGLWGEDRLSMLMDCVKKLIGYGTKFALGAVTGISLFQSMITPVIDSLKNTTLQKAVGAIPGIGDAADGIAQVVLGSAVLIKNSIGVVLLLFLLLICAVPLCKILLISWLIKGCAAVSGMISDKRISDCTERIGEGGLLLLKTTFTTVALFIITVAIAAYTTNRGF